MSRRSKASHALQVFPFLAVLVCTMGSLIFLLLLTTKKVKNRENAFAAFQLVQQDLDFAKAHALPLVSINAVEPTPELPPPGPSPLPDSDSKPDKSDEEDEAYQRALEERRKALEELKSQWRLRAEQLVNERNKHRTKKSRHEKLVAAAAEKNNELKGDLAKLEVEAGRVKKKVVAASAEMSFEEERESLEQQIVAMKKRLRAAQLVDQVSGNEKFQVVPFDPRTGTTRRPILIECSGEGIRFLPENILITPEDLTGFTPRFNPIAAGTAALINYWVTRNQQQKVPRAEPEPYVLLLIRPDGVTAYYVALKMLEPIRTQHGYELIEESTALKLPEIEPAANVACRTAVDRLLADREQITRVAIDNGLASEVFGVDNIQGGASATAGRGNRGMGGSSRGTRSGSTANDGTDGGSFEDDDTVIAKPSRKSFTLEHVTGGDKPQVGSHSWERIENFEGQPRRRKKGAGSDTGIASGSESGTGSDSGSGSPSSDGTDSGTGPVPGPGTRTARNSKSGSRPGSGSSGPSGSSVSSDSKTELAGGQGAGNDVASNATNSGSPSGQKGATGRKVRQGSTGAITRNTVDGDGSTVEQDSQANGRGMPPSIVGSNARSGAGTPSKNAGPLAMGGGAGQSGRNVAGSGGNSSGETGVAGDAGAVGERNIFGPDSGDNLFGPFGSNNGSASDGAGEGIPFESDIAGTGQGASGSRKAGASTPRNRKNSGGSSSLIFEGTDADEGSGSVDNGQIALSQTGSKGTTSGGRQNHQLFGTDSSDDLASKLGGLGNDNSFVSKDGGNETSGQLGEGGGSTFGTTTTIGKQEGDDGGGSPTADRGRVSTNGAVNGRRGMSGGVAASSAGADAGGISSDSTVGSGFRRGSTGGSSSQRSPAAPSNGDSIGQGSPGRSDSLTPGEPGMPIGERPKRKRGQAADAEEEAMGRLTDGDNGISEGDSSGEGASGSTSPPSSSRSRSSQSMGKSSSGFSPNSGPPPADVRPTSKRSKPSKDADKPLQPEMLKNHVWGTCEPGASIGFERVVHVEVSDDRVVIGEKNTVPLNGDQSQQETFERFVQQLDKHSREWGQPPHGFYWSPRLRFVVKPGGSENHELVNGMMRRAGMATTSEFVKQSKGVVYGHDDLTEGKPGTTGKPAAGGGKKR